MDFPLWKSKPFVAWLCIQLKNVVRMLQGDYIIRWLYSQCWCLSWQKNNNEHHRNWALFFCPFHSVNGFCGYRCQFTYFHLKIINKLHLLILSLWYIHAPVVISIILFFGIAFQGLVIEFVTLIRQSVNKWNPLGKCMASTFKPLFMA